MVRGTKLAILYLNRDNPDSDSALPMRKEFTSRNKGMRITYLSQMINGEGSGPKGLTEKIRLVMPLKSPMSAKVESLVFLTRETT